MDSHKDHQQQKEGGYVGNIKDRFEKQSNMFNEEWISSTDGKNLDGIRGAKADG